MKAPRLKISGMILCVGALLSGTTYAQETNQAPESFICNYVGKGRLNSPQDICNYLSFTSNRHAERVVERILQPVGLTRNFVVVECPNTENCFATVVDGKRFIIYDGQFMKQVENLTNTDWSATSIVAHEIGHHLQGHTIDGLGSRPSKELEADRFSGFVLHQLGASLDESLIAIRTLSSEESTDSHPGLGVRVEAISRGWNEAEKMYPLWNKTPATLVNPTITASNNGGVYKPAAKAPVSKPTPSREEVVETDITYHAPKGCASGDCYNGPGILIRENQERYEGNFQNGKKHGFGVQYYPGGAIRYKGIFRDDLRSGEGTYYFTNGDKFVGFFLHNVPEGKGTYFYADGERFAGNFHEGMREGYGVLTRSNGTREAGYYREDERVR
ncbi:hypothetical protein [Persicitalea jodogahamensis]|uniref:Peptidase M48 domain-containing protein n=1 Tax=Persicitalea jodogahamensis TaxID=402147 RepID=A0A8J3G797_9BACT|nr:hypothetical protein [Persicitalea jodogahamensis]GHB53852.1 hypothetical protein GCM10007390_03450 [Persicitalea jodogahamensis]